MEAGYTKTYSQDIWKRIFFLPFSTLSIIVIVQNPLYSEQLPSILITGDAPGASRFDVNTRLLPGMKR